MMSEVTEEFLEAFKHLDKLCREIFQAERGIKMAPGLSKTGTLLFAN